jgi:hypothetical protein
MPLGWVGASGGGGATATYELISTTLVGSSTPSVTFNLTAGNQAAYKHLQVRITSRFDRAQLYTGFGMRFNGDTAANYARHHLYGQSGSAGSVGLGSQNFMVLGDNTAGTETSGVFSAQIIDIVDAFSTNKNKVIRAIHGMPSPNTANAEIMFSSGLWVNTSAISSMTFLDIGAGSNLVSGSRFSLYGVRG